MRPRKKIVCFAANEEYLAQYMYTLYLRGYACIPATDEEQLVAAIEREQIVVALIFHDSDLTKRMCELSRDAGLKVMVLIRRTRYTWDFDADRVLCESQEGNMARVINAVHTLAMGKRGPKKHHPVKKEAMIA